MKTSVDEYPVFEANQVLTNRHLNMLVDYLDEQERLTRANLIGIGIVCGLELTIDTSADTVSITKGCAVTSHGYLIAEPEDVKLTAYRAYALPTSDLYEPFMSGGTQIPIWELFEDGEPDTTALDSPADFLRDKEVLLFVELHREDLSDCSPNNCDDKGSEVSVTVRRLAMSAAHAKELLVSAGSKIDEKLKMNLPDLRLRRYDVPRTGLETTRDVLQGFQDVVRNASLATNMHKALSAAYTAFRPLLSAEYSTSPFSSFLTRYSFLESVPTAPQQIGFMQYYMDLIEDLINAYDEFRWKGLELECVCLPDHGLFPRHVVLGPNYRTGWMPSSATCCDCEDLRKEVLLLFRRLVEICLRFSDTPSLPPASLKTKLDSQIRITPSRHGSALSRKSIPYYYELNGTPPIYRVWNEELTSLNRANQNLGYRSTDYMPAAPTFITQAVAYDLEPFNFFRIEGHLGKNWQRALATIRFQRDTYRLPFDVVAVRTGAFDDDVEIDLDDFDCHFRDLEAMYDALRDELLCLAQKTLASFGKLKTTRTFTTVTGTGSRSKDSILYRNLATKYFSTPGTVGFVFAQRVKEVGFSDVAIPGASSVFNSALTSMSMLVRFTLMLEDDLHLIDWVEFEQTWDRLKTLSEEIGLQEDSEEADDGLSWQELNRQIISVVYACRIEGFIAIRDEYLRRLAEVKRLRFLTHFADKHPGLQHKAGVPVGGTFVIVYHEPDLGSDNPVAEEDFTNLRLERRERRDIVEEIDIAEGFDVEEGFDIAERISILEEIGIRERFGLGERFGFDDRFRPGRLNRNEVYDAIIESFPSGTVIADFFLPYLCCSDCPPIQYIMGEPTEEPPAEPPVVTATVGCTTPNNVATVSITVAGGEAPYKLSIDGGALQDLPDSVSLQPGTHTLQVTDADGLHSTAVSVNVAEMLTTSDPTFVDDPANRTYTASFTISGGTAPYAVSTGTVSNGVVTIGPLESGATTTITVTDKAGCTTSVTITHIVEEGCDKPCGGKARRCRYPAWTPNPGRGRSYVYEVISAFEIELLNENGDVLFSEDVRELARSILEGREITAETHKEVMTKLTLELSAFIASKVGDDTFIITYDAEGGMLQIERYDCHRFTMSFAFMIVERTGIRSELWTYTPSGVFVRQTEGGRARYEMPSFGCISLDKCEDIVGKDCRVEIERLTPEQGDGTVVLVPGFDSSVDPRSLRYFWRVDAATMISSTKPQVEVPTEGTRTIQVQLLVIDRQGCWDFISVQLGSTRTTSLRLTNRIR